MSETERHYATIWEAIADRIPDSTALRHGDRTTTWRQFDERSSRFAGALLEHGIGVQETVGNFLYNDPAYFEAWFGAVKVRCRPFNVNYRYRGNELWQLLDNTEAKALVYAAALRDRVATILDRFPDLRLLVEVGDDGVGDPLPRAVRFEDLIAGSEPAPRIERPGSDVYFNFTGGTTGLPKGVLVEIQRSVTTAMWFRDRYLGRTHDDDVLDVAMALHEAGDSFRTIPASPVMHSVGFIFSSLPTLLTAGEVTTLEHHGFDAHQLLDAVETTQANVTAIVGDAFGLPMVRALDEGRPDGRPYDTSSLRVIGSGGLTFSVAIKQRLLDHIPQVALLDACGSTEGVNYGFRTVRLGDEMAPGSFEQAPGVKVLSPDLEELPIGETGLLAGPTHGTGYHRNAERSAETYLHIDGVQYAVPGDLGRIEHDGTVTLIGRGVTTINTGGEKVYPAEVEAVVTSLPDVDDCLVLGVPDERLGERVAALVVPAPGALLDLDALRASVREQLAGYKVPDRILVVEAVPRAPNGKVDYPAAKSSFADVIDA